MRDGGNIDCCFLCDYQLQVMFTMLPTVSSGVNREVLRMVVGFLEQDCDVTTGRFISDCVRD
jgi:hypothetical protein